MGIRKQTFLSIPVDDSLVARIPSGARIATITKRAKTGQLVLHAFGYPSNPKETIQLVTFKDKSHAPPHGVDYLGSIANLHYYEDRRRGLQSKQRYAS